MSINIDVTPFQMNRFYPRHSDQPTKHCQKENIYLDAFTSLITMANGFDRTPAYQAAQGDLLGRRGTSSLSIIQNHLPNLAKALTSSLSNHAEAVSTRKECEIAARVRGILSQHAQGGTSYTLIEGVSAKKTPLFQKGARKHLDSTILILTGYIDIMHELHQAHQNRIQQNPNYEIGEKALYISVLSTADQFYRRELRSAQQQASNIWPKESNYWKGKANELLTPPLIARPNATRAEIAATQEAKRESDRLGLMN